MIAKLYKCDPKKNADCPKTMCAFSGERDGCDMTSHPEFAQTDADGKPIVATVVFKELPEIKRDSDSERRYRNDAGAIQARGGTAGQHD